MRSRDVVSSSSAARLTAPSAAISRLMRSISPCRPCSLTPAVARCDCASASRSTCAAVELLEVLRAAQLRRLLFELQLGDALAQRLQAALEQSGAARRLRAQLGVRSSYSLRCAASAASRSQLQRQRGLQAGLRRRVVERAPARRAAAPPPARWPPPAAAAVSMARCSSARRAASVRDCELRLLRLALQCALLLARRGQRALGGDHRLVELGMALLGVGQLHVELFEARFAGGAALVPAPRAGRRSRPVRRRAGCCARWSARPAASGAAARPAAGARGSAPRRLRGARVARRCEASV